jgi:hypothetical protein
MRAMRRRSSAEVDAATTPFDTLMAPTWGQQTHYSSQMCEPERRHGAPSGPLAAPLREAENGVFKPNARPRRPARALVDPAPVRRPDLDELRFAGAQSPSWPRMERGLVVTHTLRTTNS